MNYSDIPKVFVWTGVCALALALFITITYSFFPSWYGFLRKAERASFEQSHQFVQSKQSMLLTLADEYDELGVQALQMDPEVASALRMQQDSIKERMQREVFTMPADYTLPTNISRILGGDPR